MRSLPNVGSGLAQYRPLYLSFAPQFNRRLAKLRETKRKADILKSTGKAPPSPQGSGIRW
jgi:hypothetical protein